MRKIWLSKVWIGVLVGLILLVAGAATYSLLVQRDDLGQESNLVTNADGFNYAWAEDNRYIAHALGGIMGRVYTNSYEAFLLNYQMGHRVFEVDFARTDDDKIVGIHDIADWKMRVDDVTELTGDVVRSKLLDGKFHTVDLELLVDLLIKYPDIYLMTDSKYGDQATTRRIFNEIVNLVQAKAGNRANEVLDRVIVQIYHTEMFEWVMEVYPWKSVVYTLYQEKGWTAEGVLEFAKRTGVKVITIYVGRLNDEVVQLWTQNGLIVATHTLNNLDEVEILEKRGVKMFYTDFLIP